MIDDQSVDVQAFVVGVGFSVLQQLQEEVGGLLGPATNGGSPLFGLGSAADATVEATEGNAFLELSDVLQEALSAAEGHTFDGKRRLASVLQN